MEILRSLLFKKEYILIYPKKKSFIKEVALPYLTFQSKPHCGQCDIWLGGELEKGVAFIYVFVTILSKPIFFMFSGLLVFLFMKLLYYTAYFFNSKLAPIFAPLFFCVFL